MSEQGKVRLVRCPKCENVLPELNDYSVYQCGGCGAVLRAKRTIGEIDALSEKSDEERIGGVSERYSQKSEDIETYEKRMNNLSDASEDDVRSKDSSFSRERTRFFNDGGSSMARAGKRIVQDIDGIDKNVNGIGYTKMEKDFDNMKQEMGNAMGPQRSLEMPDWRIRESDIEGFRMAQRIDEVDMRYSTQKYPEEGQLNYHLQGRYTYGEPLPGRNEMMGFGEVTYPGEDRAELLQKLDELRDKLSRSCDLADKTKDKFPHHRRMVPQDPYGYSDKWFSEGHSAMHRAPAPVSFPDNRAERPSYIINQYSDPSPSVDRHAMVGYGIYPPSHTSGHAHEFEDPIRPQIRKHPHQASAPYQQKPSPAHFSGPYRGGNIFPVDSFESYPPAINHHRPSCSCFQCYSKYQAPPQHPPNVYADRQFSDGSKNRAFFHHEYPNEYAPLGYSGKVSDTPSFQSRSSQSHSRWPIDLNSEASDLVRNRPSRVLLTNSGRQCRPIAGGAPFLACQNCHELLQLPKKTSISNTKQKKIRCGACSALIILVVDTKRLDISVHVEANIASEKEHLSHKKNLSEGSSYAHVHPNRASMNFSSEDYDNSGYDFRSMDRELESASAGQKSSNKSGDIRNSHSTYSSFSGEEDKLESSPAARKVSNSADLTVKGKLSPPPAGSPLQDYFDYSNKYHVVNRFGDGNRSGSSEQDKSIRNKTTLREDSIKDASATEIEISSNEYSNTGTSLDSGEVNKGGVQLRANNTAESFFAGIMKKSFRDFNKSNSNVEQEKPNITVNGNLIADRLIKKAEKLSGPIHPGHYWYDFRAGFWGVLGGPCLGIIPPFIEEFNYPIPENCSGGKTGVFVNGRELHQKDLNLLSSRGLPTESDRSYIIEVSGRVLDEDTGEELESLGKLAPTIERFKRGFGMKDPKAKTQLMATP